MTQYVKYVGAAHRRVVSTEDWRSVGIDAPLAIWHAQNGFAIPLDMFTENQLKRAIKPDPNFVITEEGDEFEPAPQNQDMTPRELIQATENPVDVLDMLNTGTRDAAAISGPSTGAAPNGGRVGDAREEVLEDTEADQVSDSQDSSVR